MPIVLQFICEDSLASSAIAWFSAGAISHVDCVLDDNTLLGARSDKVGGRPAGVQIRPVNYATFTRRVIMTIAANDIQKAKFNNFLMKQLGKPYDTEAIWAFMFNRNWRELDSWICSELQAAALEASGVFNTLYLAANKITPVSLALAASAIGGIYVTT
jgi:uncharacterized protein YycO